jgi:GNAT superfamily N-acetyltransferase
VRRELTDEGELIATYEYVERAGNRVIDTIALHVPVERAAPVFHREFPGHRIAGSPKLGHALEQLGAIPSRHAHRYVHGGSDEPPQVPPGVRLEPVDGRDLLPAYRASGAEWDEPAVPERLIAEASALAVADGRVVGAILVGDEDRLIFDVFRDPAFPGTGKALIQHALNAGPLTLVVTDGNPAERLYQRLGFTHAYEAYSVDL